MLISKLLKSKAESVCDLSLSVSKSKTFVDCPAKYKFCYIEKLPRIEQDFHIFGTFLHAVLEEFHASIIENPDQDDLQLMSAIKEKVLADYKEKVTDQQVIDGWKIIDEYLELRKSEKETGTLPNVTHVEKEFYIDLDSGIDDEYKVLVNGFIDRVQVDHDGVMHVADYKTTKDKKYLKDFFQLKTYAYVLMLEDPSLQRIRASFILLRHGFSKIEEEYTRKDVECMGEKFMEYARQIKEEKLFRAKPQFLCKYCDYLKFCKAGESFLVKKGVIEAPIKKKVGGFIKW